MIEGIFFSQTSEIYFCRGFSYCPYYRGVRNREVSARRELTVLPLNQKTVKSHLNVNPHLESPKRHSYIQHRAINIFVCYWFSISILH